MFSMKKLLISIFALWCAGSSAQNAAPFSVVACPGEDVSTCINLSWGVDTLSNNRSVSYTLRSDRDWRRARTVESDTRLCTTYDSVYSKNAANENFYEQVRFTKCDAALSGLKPDTEYKYRIGSDTTVRYFRTAGAKRWSAGIIADFHSYPPLPARLTAAMNMIGSIERFDPSISWMLHLGDVCAWGGSYSFWRRMYEEPVFGRYMWAGVNGNHDNMTRTYGLSNAFLRDANFYPRNGYEGEEGVCYFFRYGDALFVMLNSESMRSDEGLEAAQNWVRKVVAENPARYVIVCEHYQWFFGTDGRFSQYTRWCELFDELGVDLALAGNNHIYVRSAPLRGGEVTDGTVGTVYLQLPSSDNERGHAYVEEWTNNRDIIRSRWYEGEKTVGAVHLAADRRYLVLTLLDRNGMMIDRVEIPAKRR